MDTKMKGMTFLERDIETDERKINAKSHSSIGEMVAPETKILQLEKILSQSLEEYFGGKLRPYFGDKYTCGEYVLSYNENENCNYRLKEIKLPVDLDPTGNLVFLTEMIVPKNTTTVVSYHIKSIEGKLYHCGTAVIRVTGKRLISIFF